MVVGIKWGKGRYRRNTASAKYDRGFINYLWLEEKRRNIYLKEIYTPGCYFRERVQNQKQVNIDLKSNTLS